MQRSRPQPVPHPCRPARLLAGLVLAAALSACGEAAGSGDAILVRVVDEEGRPATWARVLERSMAGREARSRWDGVKAVVHLPRAGAPYDLHISAAGKRTVRANGVVGNREIALRAGYPVELHRTGDAVDPTPPRLLVFRVRLATKENPHEDAAALERVSEVAELTAPRRKQGTGAVAELPTRGWGFGIAESDAHAGLLLPEPGEYVVHWGLFDTEAQTWLASADEPIRFTIPDVGEVDPAPLQVELPISEEALRTVRMALGAQIARQREEGGQ